MKASHGFICVLLWVVAAGAQPLDSLWSRTYGGVYWDECNAVRQTSDGGFIMVGVTESFGVGVGQWYAVRTDADGDTLWTRMYGGNSWDECYTVEETTDGGFILGGQTHSLGGGDDIWLVKTDAAGNLLWSRGYGGAQMDYCYSVLQTTDGGFVVGGNTQSYGAGYVDFWLIKTDANGDSEWTRTFGGSSLDVCRTVLQTDDSGFLLCGYSRSFGAAAPNAASIWLVKTDQDGDSVWSWTFSGLYGEACSSVEQTTDGGYILTGLTYSFGAGTPTQPNMLLLRMDENGDSLWSRAFGGGDMDVGMSVQQTNDGGFVVGGYTSSFGDEALDAWLVMTDSLGDSLWSETFGGHEDDQCISIRQTADGSFVLGGYTSSFGEGAPGYPNMWLLSVGMAENTEDAALPESPHLLEAFPNPFNATAAISFVLAHESPVTLTVYDVTGREVVTLADEVFSAGEHRLVWNGRGHSSGLYMLRMTSREFVSTQKIVLMK